MGQSESGVGRKVGYNMRKTSSQPTVNPFQYMPQSAIYVYAGKTNLSERKGN